MLFVLLLALLAEKEEGEGEGEEGQWEKRALLSLMGRFYRPN